MNEITIPLAPLWFNTCAFTCAPDNTLVYAAKHALVIVKNPEKNAAAEVKHVPDPHARQLISVSVNKKWGCPRRHVATMSEGGETKVWDADTLQEKFLNKKPLDLQGRDEAVGAVFAGDDRIVSVSTNGCVNVWNIISNESKLMKLFRMKMKITCLSSCPHAPWLMAFGESTGQIIITDMRRNGCILYNLRGHFQSIISLTWCPVPINIFPTNSKNFVAQKTGESLEIQALNETFDDHTKTETSSKPSVTINDFLKECEALKRKILNETAPEESCTVEVDSESIVEKQEIENLTDEEEDQEEEQSGRDLPSHYDPSNDFIDNITEINFEEKKDNPEKVVKDEEEINDSGVAIIEEESQEIEEESQAIVEELLESCIEANVSTIEANVSTTEAVSTIKDVSSNIEEISSNIEVATNIEETPKVEESEPKESLESCIELPNISTTELASSNAQIAPNIEEITSNNEETPKVVEESQTESSDNNATKQLEASSKVFGEDPRFEYLLASTSRDSKLSIWRAGTDGRLQTFFKIPAKSKKSNDGWIVAHWIEPKTIVTSSMQNQLLSWTLPRPIDNKNQCKILHLENESIIFCMASPTKLYTEYNWRQKHANNLWTFDRNGVLINFDMSEKQVVNIYPCTNSRVSCIEQSILDPNHLLIAHFDGRVRVWDLGKSHTTKIQMKEFNQKVWNKLTAIAWHPNEEMLFAGATKDGRVFLHDISGRKTEKLEQFFNSPVYKVQWGPYDNEMKLYAMANGQIIVHDKKTIKEPEQFQKLQIHRFAWKLDHELLLLSTYDGALIIMDKHLETLARLFLSTKGSNSIVWHPDSCTDQGERSKWFALTTNKGLLVYNFDSVQNDNYMENIVASFEGHLRPPSSLAWNPFNSDQIVSAGPDGIAHVWNVTEKQLIATFVDGCHPHEPQVAWSPIDGDFVIYCDSTIKIWKVSEHPPRNDDGFVKERNGFLKSDQKSESKPKTKAKVPKNCIVPPIMASNDENFTEQVGNMRKILNGNISCGDTLDPLQIFSTKSDVNRLLSTNYELHKTEHKHKYAELISLWNGNISESIREAIDENRVTPLVINLAPMVSLSLWREACEVYAKKLTETTASDPLESATYFLAVHKVEEAIDSLCMNEMFREALALAKTRLPDNSAIVQDVTEKWAKYCVDKGNFETAVQCYLSIGRQEEAAKVLSRRGNREFLEFAAELADKAGIKELHESIKFKLRNFVSITPPIDAEGLQSDADATLEKSE